jgi:hypothetical protein
MKSNLLLLLLIGLMGSSARAGTILHYAGSGSFADVMENNPFGAPAAGGLEYTTLFEFLLPGGPGGPGNQWTTWGKSSITANGVTLNYEGAVSAGITTDSEDGEDDEWGRADLRFGDLEMFFEAYWPGVGIYDTSPSVFFRLGDLGANVTVLFQDQVAAYSDIDGAGLIGTTQVPESGSTLAGFGAALMILAGVRRRTKQVA